MNHHLQADFEDRHVRFEQAVLEQQRRFKTGLLSYVAGAELRERRGPAAHAHIDDLWRIANDLELRRKIRELERDSERPFNDLLARHHQPQQERQRDRNQLQADMPTEVQRGHQNTARSVG